jgi:hypothetical protein
MKTNAKKFGVRYPWEKWFRRKSFTLQKGRDYECRTYTMAQAIRNAAAPDRHNKVVHIRIDDERDRLRVCVEPRANGKVKH